MVIAASRGWPSSLIRREVDREQGMWVKICGVTRIADAESVAACGANAIGFNFFCGSRRFVDPDIAAALVAAARRHHTPQLVGVFVNSPAAEVLHVARSLNLDAIQFHGDESPELIATVHDAAPELLLIRAVRVSPDRLNLIADQLQQLKDRVPLFAVLVDPFVSGHYGGTGRLLSIEPPRLQELASGSRLILAGGLTPSNVSQQAEQFSPWGVDTASGVEHTPGVKDAGLVLRFVSECKSRSAPDTTR
jgi:phosphoribosylanthranilate isomerase